MKRPLILLGMYKVDDDQYKIGEEDWGEPVIVDKETMISEFMWIGLSEKESLKLIEILDKEYKKENDRIGN